MSDQEYLRQGMDFLHAAFRDARSGQMDEQLHFVPPEGSHSIAWVLWHAARIEDSIIQRIAQDKDPIWREGGWVERTGLPPKGIGTGQSTDEAQQVHLANVDAFAGYADAVAAATDGFLAAATDADLQREVKVGERTETVGGAILLHLVTHLNGHRGEINLLRGIQGLEPVVPTMGG